MKIITIKCEHTRQVIAFNPVRFEIGATLTDGEDPIRAAKELQRLVLQITYKDRPIERDSLIRKLVDCEPKVENKQALNNLKSNIKPMQQNEDFLNQKSDDFPDFSPEK